MRSRLSSPSIVSILTLDRLDLTKKAVNSVLERSTGDVRLVFLDNGSRDGTLDYLAQLEKEHSSLVDILRSDENLGVAAGRNRIFRHVISKYGDQFGWVLNLDNDCVVHPGYDKALTTCFEETDALAVCPRLIQPDGRIFHNAYDGFLINLQEMQLKLEYGDSVDLPYNDPRVSERKETDVILGTSAKTSRFLEQIGFYDEGHRIGWEDFSIALRALGLSKEDFQRWKSENRNGGKEWVPLRELMGQGEQYARHCVMYEPECVITHDHPVTEVDQRYEKIRWHSRTIAESTAHFERVWGVKPVM